MLFKSFKFILIFSQLNIAQGLYWEIIDASLKSRATTFSFNSNNDVFIGTDGNGLYKLNFDDNIWENIDEKISSGRIDCISFVNNDGLYIGVSCTKSYVFEDHPYGVYHLKSNSKLPEISYSTLYVWSMLTDHSGNLFACTDNWQSHIMKLNDISKNWGNAESGLPNDFYTKIISDYNGNMYVTIYDSGLYKSTDNGANWILIDNAFNNIKINDININSKGHLYAEYDRLGLYKSSDQGKTWHKINFEIEYKNYWQITGILFNQKDDLFINIFQKGIFRSNNEGETWELISDDLLDNNISCFGIDHLGFLWAGHHNKKIFRTINSTMIK